MEGIEGRLFEQSGRDVERKIPFLRFSRFHVVINTLWTSPPPPIVTSHPLPSFSLDTALTTRFRRAMAQRAVSGAANPPRRAKKPVNYGSPDSSSSLSLDRIVDQPDDAEEDDDEEVVEVDAVEDEDAEGEEVDAEGESEYESEGDQAGTYQHGRQAGRLACLPSSRSRSCNASWASDGII